MYIILRSQKEREREIDREIERVREHSQIATRSWRYRKISRNVLFPCTTFSLSSNPWVRVIEISVHSARRSNDFVRHTCAYPLRCTTAPSRRVGAGWQPLSQRARVDYWRILEWYRIRFCCTVQGRVIRRNVVSLSNRENRRTARVCVRTCVQRAAKMVSPLWSWRAIGIGKDTRIWEDWYGIEWL